MLASTQDLHQKIEELSNRVRELEDGLRQSHGMHSQETHPLLSEDLLRIKAPLQRENLSVANGNSDEPGGDVVDSFGSLSISDTGRTNYFGQATSSWVRTIILCIWPHRSDTATTVFLTGTTTHTLTYLDSLLRVRQNEQHEQEKEDRLGALRKILPAEILAMSGFFPIAPNLPATPDLAQDRGTRLKSIYWYLPPADEAADLRHIYFQHAGA